MKKTILTAIVSSLLLTGMSIAQIETFDSLTLKQAIELTLRDYPSIHQAEENLASSEARIGLSRVTSYPDVSLVSQYTRLGPVPTIAMGSRGSSHMYPEDNYNFNVGMRYTLYDFGRNETAVRLAESAHQAAAENLDLVRFNLAYQTVSIFQTILILHQTISVIDEQIETLQQHLAVSVKKIQAGTATDYDTLTTQVRIALARNERIDAARALETQEIRIRQLTGLAADYPIRLKGSFAELGPAPDIDSLLKTAEEQRPDLALSREAENGALLQKQLASLGGKPTLTLGTTTGFKNGYYPEISTIKGNFSAGLYLNVPIFNGHLTRFRKAEAGAGLQSARWRTSELRQQVMTEVRQAVAAVKSDLEKIAGSDLQVKQAEQALAMARTRYEAGVVTNLELLDAETALARTKLIRLRAQYDYTVSLISLDRATGKRIW